MIKGPNKLSNEMSGNRCHIIARHCVLIDIESREEVTTFSNHAGRLTKVRGSFLHLLLRNSVAWAECVLGDRKTLAAVGKSRLED